MIIRMLMKYAAAAGDRLGNEVVVSGGRQVEGEGAYVHSDKRRGLEMTRHKIWRLTAGCGEGRTQVKLKMNVR